MDDSLFRKLGPAEEQKFRQWARDNYDPNKEPEEVWHPVVRAEWSRLHATHLLNTASFPDALIAVQRWLNQLTPEQRQKAESIFIGAAHKTTGTRKTLGEIKTAEEVEREADATAQLTALHALRESGGHEPR